MCVASRSSTSGLSSQLARCSPEADGSRLASADSYRLCPLASALTEECFRQTPLAFAGEHSWFRWFGAEGRRSRIERITTRDEWGVAWAKNPVPRAWRKADGVTWAEDNPRNGGSPSAHWETGEGFQPRCNHTEQFPCAGEWNLHQPEIVDLVQIPRSLRPGSYVLSWRWDAEQSYQIMSSCADVEVVAW
jgi:hypothetical protein